MLLSRERFAWLGGAVAIAGLAALTTLVAYKVSPLIAVILPVAAALMAGIVIYPMVGIYAGVLAAPLEFFSVRLGAVAGLSAAELLFLATAAATILHAALRARTRGVEATHVAFALVIAVCATGLAFAPDTLVVSKIVLMWSAFLALSVRVSRASRRELMGLSVAVAVAAAVVGVIALAHGGQAELLNGGATATNRAQAGFSQPNILGFFLVLTLPTTVALGLMAPAAWRVPAVVGAGIVFAALMLTLSRGAIIGSAASVLVLLTWSTFRRAAIVLLLALVAFSATNYSSITGSREVSIVSQRLNTAGQERYTNPRLQIYAAVPTMVADHPYLGVGEGNFSQYSARYGLRDIGGGVFEHAHDLLFTIAVETGLIGLTFFVIFLAGLGRSMLAIVRSRDAPTFPPALAFVAGLSGLGVASILDYPLRENFVMALVMLQVGAVLAYARIAREN